MNISQPTFHRIVLSARKKIADAIINGKAIKIESGATPNPTIDTMAKIAKGLGVSMDDLMK